mmetsp:Transcript_31458/g.98704  ORF Transcript_31458/g.98704 Transcript_31458/m.98704 type:complete len:257 (+) Transcript_31458:702-1472(+)
MGSASSTPSSVPTRRPATPGTRTRAGCASAGSAPRPWRPATRPLPLPPLCQGAAHSRRPRRRAQRLRGPLLTYRRRRLPAPSAPSQAPRAGPPRACPCPPRWRRCRRSRRTSRSWWSRWPTTPASCASAWPRCPSSAGSALRGFSCRSTGRAKRRGGSRRRSSAWAGSASSRRRPARRASESALRCTTSSPSPTPSRDAFRALGRWRSWRATSWRRRTCCGTSPSLSPCCTVTTRSSASALGTTTASPPTLLTPAL